MKSRKVDADADLADYQESSDPRADLIRISIISAKRKGDAAEVERLTAMLADHDSKGASGPPPQ